MNTMKLNERAMLVSLKISAWSAARQDKKIAAEVEAKHGAKLDSGRYSKFLIDRKKLEPLTKLAGEARAAFYAKTLPWTDDGSRILPAALYLEFTTQMSVFRSKYEDLRDEFAREYPALVEQARRDLNGMFDYRDYPANVASKFEMLTRVMPLPDASDFRVDLGDAEQDRVKQQIEESMRESTAAAMADCWERLHAVVGAVSERLNQPEAIFRDSLIGNLREVCAILPKLNILGDPKLDDLAREAERRIANRATPQDLRNDYLVRKDVARAADDILAQMSSYIGVAA